MYNHEAPAQRKLILRSLLICWLIILGGYLLIRMVFLVFGLQLHLTAQGICLALLPYCFGSLYLWKRCKKQKPWFYVLGLPASCRCREADAVFSRSVSVRGRSIPCHGGHGGNRKDRTVCRYSLHGCPCGTQSTCCSLTDIYSLWHRLPATLLFGLILTANKDRPANR